MSQYLPGRLNVIFLPSVDLKTAVESLGSAGVVLDEPAVQKALAPFVDNPAPVRLQVQVELYKEAEWIERINVLEEVDLCVRTQRKGGCTPPGSAQRF